jgi:hypothetical protein
VNPRRRDSAQLRTKEKMMVKHLAAEFIALFVVTLAAVSAHAAPVGFNGPYDYSTWISTTTFAGPNQANSSIDVSHQTLTLYEPGANEGGQALVPFDPQEFRFSHNVDATGTVSFDWLFQLPAPPENCCAGLNFYVNNTQYHLAGTNFDNPYATADDSNGAFSVAVNAGDTIAFGVFSGDACCGISAATITNFDVMVGSPTSAVPEPASLCLLGLGLLGVAQARRRRQ